MTTGPTRRETLVAAGAVSLGVAALAACSSSETPAKPTATATVPKDKVPVGGGYVDQNAGIVVTQPTEGEFKAFGAKCPHQGCLVGEVKDGQIECPCHQSYFDATTGERKAGPAKTGLPAVAVKVSGSDVVAGG